MVIGPVIAIGLLPIAINWDEPETKFTLLPYLPAPHVGAFTNVPVNPFPLKSCTMSLPWPSFISHRPDDGHKICPLLAGTPNGGFCCPQYLLIMRQHQLQFAIRFQNSLELHPV